MIRGRGPLAPFCLLVGAGGLGIFIVAYLGMALTGHQLRAALAREQVALQAQHEAEAQRWVPMTGRKR